MRDKDTETKKKRCKNGGNKIKRCKNGKNSFVQTANQTVNMKIYAKEKRKIEEQHHKKLRGDEKLSGNPHSG